MGTRPKKSLSPERAAKLKQIKRATRLRAKVERGTASAAERAELDSLPRLRRGRPPKEVSHEAAAELDGQPDENAATIEPDVETPPAPPNIPREAPPPPPSVRMLGGGGSRGDDWRGKYQHKVGREAACVQIASVYCGLLKRLSAFIVECGARPVLDDKSIDDIIAPAAILTADKFLPDGLELGPEVEVAIGSGMLCVQAAIQASRRKKGAKPTPPSAPKDPYPSQEQHEAQRAREASEIPVEEAATKKPNGHKVPDGALY